MADDHSLSTVAPHEPGEPDAVAALEALLVQSRAQQSRLRSALADILVLVDRNAS